LSVIAIIPFSSKNKYSINGDLMKWGGSTLIEWKLSQVALSSKIDKVILTSTDKNIPSFEDPKVEIHHSSKNDLNDRLMEIIKDIDEDDYILWVNSINPFFGKKTFDRMIDHYMANEDDFFQGLVPIRKLKGFFFSDDFSYKNYNIFEKFEFRRDEIAPVNLIVNGAYMNSVRNIQTIGWIFGDKPNTFEVDWLNSIEISSLEEIKIYEALIEPYLIKESF